MKLRARLVVAVVAAALPLAAGIVWLRADLEERRVADVLREYAVARMEAGGRERCEASPETFPEPPRSRAAPSTDDSPAVPPVPFGAPDDPMPSTAEERAPPPPPLLPEKDERTRLWAYDSEFRSANTDAPDVASELSDDVRSGADVAMRPYEGPSGRGHEALVRMAWTDGPCAFVLVRRTSISGAGGAADAWWTGAFLALGVLVALLLAFAPVVRRIRRLEADVRRSAAGTYASGVDVSGDDEIAALAHAFNDAAQEVRARVDAVHAREETLRRFVANTTHDLMTPLTVLQGHLSVLREAIDDTDGDANAAVRDAVREVDYTTSLVANLGTAAKLEADPDGVSLHSVDMSDLVSRIAARFGPVARAADVELNHATPEEPVVVQGDVTLLEQAVGNVVQNAVRYNASGGHVAVALHADGSSFEIQVDDDGPGVPEAELAGLAERGSRGAEARSRSPAGKGLGLDITRSVCERHGFDLTFSRSAHGGLRVSIRG